MQNHKIAPSKLNFNLGGCDRCYAEALHGERWPARPFPGLFSRLDLHQRDYFDGQPTSIINADLPPGTIRNASSVKSQPFVHDDVSLTIAGRLDAVAELDDETIAVIDFKSSVPKDAMAASYRPQLCAYQYALTHPAKTQPVTVSKLGLLVVCPESMVDTNKGVAELVSTTWIEVIYDHEWFVALLETVCELAANPKASWSDPSCEWCDLRNQVTHNTTVST